MKVNLKKLETTMEKIYQRGDQDQPFAPLQATTSAIDGRGEYAEGEDTAPAFDPEEVLMDTIRDIETSAEEAELVGDETEAARLREEASKLRRRANLPPWKRPSSPEIRAARDGKPSSSRGHN